MDMLELQEELESCCRADESRLGEIEYQAEKISQASPKRLVKV